MRYSWDVTTPAATHNTHTDTDFITLHKSENKNTKQGLKFHNLNFRPKKDLKSLKFDFDFWETAQNNICLWKAGQDMGGNACASIRRNDTVRACRLHTSIFTIYILIYPYIHISKESTDISRKQLWWKLIVRFEIMKFSDRSCLWLYLIVISAEFTTTGMNIIQRGVS